MENDQNNTASKLSSLVKSLINTEERSENVNAQIAFEILEAMKKGDLPSPSIVTFSKGTDRKTANSILEDICTTYIYGYATSYQGFKNKELSAEKRLAYNDECKRIRKIMTNSLYIAAYTYQSNESYTLNKKGKFVTNAGTPEQETFSLRDMLKKSRSFHGRKESDTISKGQGKTEKSEGTNLVTALVFISKKFSGKDQEEFTKATREHALDTLAVLLDLFSVKNETDIKQVYKKSENA
jgi:hypothetical protein